MNSGPPSTQLVTTPPPTRMDLIGRCFRKILNGWGRASRREYWSFFLLVLTFCVSAIAFELNVLDDSDGGASSVFIAAFVIAIVVLGPALFFVGMRRYHDIGRSGWLYAFHMFTGFGTLFALFAMIAKSEPYDNKHGPVPPEARR